jgi:hypothetical protein
MSVSAKKRCEDQKEIEKLRQIARHPRSPETIEKNRIAARKQWQDPKQIEKIRRGMLKDRYDPNHRSTGNPATRRELYKLQNGRCWLGGEKIDLEKDRLEVHHKNHRPKDDVILNLALVCYRHHIEDTKEYRRKRREEKQNA